MITFANEISNNQIFKSMTTKVFELPKWDLVETPIITKTGKVSKRTKLEWVKNLVPCECVEVVENWRGKDVRFYVTAERMEAAKNRDYKVVSQMFDDKGNVIMGIWQHGRYGTKVHEEPALYSCTHKHIIETTDYCDGIVKDSYKYLRKINF